MSTRKTTTVDCHVGQRLRIMRKNKWMTQNELGKAVGLSFKQIRKYESGENRISSSTLYNISKALDVNIESFFLGLTNRKSSCDIIESSLIFEETESLVKQYYNTPNQGVRLTFLSVVRAIAESEENY